MNIINKCTINRFLVDSTHGTVADYRCLFSVSIDRRQTCGFHCRLQAQEGAAAAAAAVAVVYHEVYISILILAPSFCHQVTPPRAAGLE